jgi:hypothetical protein
LVSWERIVCHIVAGYLAIPAGKGMGLALEV